MRKEGLIPEFKDFKTEHPYFGKDNALPKNFYHVRNLSNRGTPIVSVGTLDKSVR